MIDTDDLANQICETASKPFSHAVLQKLSFETSNQNQLVFFLKPEVFLIEEFDKQLAVVKTTLQLFREYEASIAGCVALSGGDLAASATMDRHYGFINTMSRQASYGVDAESAIQIRHAVSAAADTPIVGGHELLCMEPQMSPYSLNAIWEKKESRKIRSGLYVQLHDLGNGPIILVNGFHPAQLAHYTSDNRRIVFLLLNSDCPWGVLRARMLGDTFPDRALPGSLRRTLHDRASAFGLGSVDITNNCVHLSAGPFEALFEIMNFLSPGLNCLPLETHLGRLMDEKGLGAYAGHVTENPKTHFAGRSETLFDMTENADSISAIELFRISFIRRDSKTS